MTADHRADAWYRSFERTVRFAVSSWVDHRTNRLGAGLAYYWLIAMVPVAFLGFWLATVLFPPEEALSAVFERFEMTNGGELEELLVDVLTSVANDASLTQVGLLSVLAAVFTASYAVVATQDALNLVWEQPRRRGVRASIYRRLLSLGSAVLVSGALTVFLIAWGILSAIESLSPDEWRVPNFVGEIAAWLLPGVLAFVLVVYLFRQLPDMTPPWRPLLIGSLVTTAALWLGTWAFLVYLDHSDSFSLVGSAATAFVGLTWMYYLAQIFLAGAELTRAIALGGRAHDEQGPRR
jgi:membrane protein